MINKEQQLFLDAIKCCVQGTKLEMFSNDIDWNEFLRIAKVQEMKALLASQIINILKDKEELKSVSDDLYMSYAAASYTYQNRLSIIGKIDAEFSKAGIPYFIFKGTEIASLYTQPELRTMGDSDILVHENDREKAHKIFIELGMKNKCKGENEWIYYYNNMEFELHCRLMNEGEVGNYQSHKDFMNRRWDYAVNNGDSMQFHLDLSYHFVFVLLHLRKHFINSGVGFRQFMDIAVMIKKCNLDWEWVMSEIEKLGLAEFTKTCFAFCKNWFGISAPIDIPKLDNTFFENSTVKIFNNGVFGFDDAENSQNYTILQIKDNQKKGKIKIFFRTLFPSYDNLRTVSAYSFVDGKPWLLPFVWVYRIFRTVLNGSAFESTAELNEKMSIQKDKIDSRKEYLNSWGLD